MYFLTETRDMPVSIAKSAAENEVGSRFKIWLTITDNVLVVNPLGNSNGRANGSLPDFRKNESTSS